MSIQHYTVNQHPIPKLLTWINSGEIAIPEIHNKPDIPYRYQIVSILLVNSWELLLKAFLIKYHSKINEETIYDEIFTETYTDVVTYCKSHIAVWKQNSTFHSFMKLLKKDKKIHKIRYLDPNNTRSSTKDFYSKNIYANLEGKYLEIGSGDNEK